ncbi:HsdM family class I SAM-dependent methyltransferase [Streptococcus anginosus]|nr:N-6 DNA methylase [Streptococcus anginosus]
MMSLQDMQTFSDIENITNIEDLAYHFDNIFPDSDRKNNGIFFTPSTVVELMTEYSLKLFNSPKVPDIFDPAVGSGVFLLGIAKKVANKFELSISEVVEEHLFGIDIMLDNTILTKILLGTLTFEIEKKIPKRFNIIQNNSLKLTKETLYSIFHKNSFDIIISNPPYVSGELISSETKQILQSYSDTVYGNPDLYIPFFEFTIKLLTPSGIGALITPNSYFRSLNGKRLRKFLISHTEDIRLINFNSNLVFDSILHYSAINFFTKKRNDSQDNRIFFLDNYKKNIKVSNFHWSSISPSPVDSWHTLNQIEKDIIAKLEYVSTTTLNDLKFQNGVATQRNNIYMFKHLHEDKNFYYFEKKSKQYQIEKSITRPFVLPNKTSRDKNLRIIFPYYYDEVNGSVTPISPTEMKRNFPLTLAYLNNFKDELSKRKYDKNMLYWYLYGRSQGLKQYGSRLYIPYMANVVSTSLSTTDDEVFAAGYAIFSPSVLLLQKISKILESKVFSFYISRVSKPYSSGYFSTAKNMIKNFSIPDIKKLENYNLETLTNEIIYSIYKLSSEEINYIEESF